MHSQYTNAQLLACRCLAMEQNKKLFDEANAISRAAFELLEQPDLDSDKFQHYLQLRRKAETLFCEALDHLILLNENFPPLPVQKQTEACDSSLHQEENS
ncbi:hypothetical protein D3C76_791370 [compost metagenome]|uniref:Uncharacterized protein n=1 Tax=Pseudomonas fluorescens TaxID=294 RepID=A0A5E6WIF3_PSEFL|nr:hypothetical protein [Pseudomonas fluorescens]VVN28433.1 hypothetical protein PS659_04748 [Pseudomonas fluorescens]